MSLIYASVGLFLFIETLIFARGVYMMRKDSFTLCDRHSL